MCILVLCNNEEIASRDLVACSLDVHVESVFRRIIRVEGWRINSHLGEVEDSPWGDWHCALRVAGE